jgi:hypothetical protein
LFFTGLIVSLTEGDYGVSVFCLVMIVAAVAEGVRRVREVRTRRELPSGGRIGWPVAIAVGLGSAIVILTLLANRLTGWTIALAAIRGALVTAAFIGWRRRLHRRHVT